MRGYIRFRAIAARYAPLLVTAVAVVGLGRAQDAQNPRMQAIGRDLGVECSYCHVTGS